MENKYQHKIFTVPNIISMFRLALIPFIIWAYIGLDNSILTTVLVVISGISDVADGFIARRFNMVSDLGKAIDPIADKLTQIAVLFCLVFKFWYMVIPLALLAVKEVIAGTTGLAVIKATNKVRSAEWHGKLATVSLYIVMAMHLIWKDIPQTVSVISVAVMTACILLSCVIYTTENIKLIRQSKQNTENK